jgi:hypothetical protein
VILQIELQKLLAETAPLLARATTEGLQPQVLSALLQEASSLGGGQNFASWVACAQEAQTLSRYNFGSCETEFSELAWDLFGYAGRCI